MKTTEEFRKELYAKYGKRLIIPDDAKYIGSKKDIKVICPKHGVKWMRPNNLLNGAQCRDCGYETVSQKNSDTPQEFLKKACKTHGDNYDYPFIFDEYGKKDKIHILCKKCGNTFKQNPALHIYGNGCPYCFPFPQKDTTESLKEKIKRQHPTIELISEHNGDNDSKITVKCVEHDITWVTTPHRLSQQKHGCIKCYENDRIKKLREKHSKMFIDFVNEYYAPLYDTSEVKYVNSKTSVNLICPIHGKFTLKPDKMLSRLDGCPYCRESHLERDTRIILDKLNIVYEREKTFDWLVNKIKMPTDFYLPEYNIVIECQGEQHIIERDDSLMNKNDNFEDKICRDKLKYNLCKEHNIPIIYIFNKLHSSHRLDEHFNHMYDDALFIEDIIEDSNILLNEIKKRSLI